MKSLLLSLIAASSLFISLWAFADASNVNDTALYEGTLTFAENKQTVGFNQRLTLTACDAVKATCSIKTTMYLPDGSSKEDVQTVPVTDVKSRSEIKTMLEKCDQLGGKSDKVVVSG